MRDHYSGDLSDFIKFSFLRLIAGVDRRFGVVWYFVPGIDNAQDGRHVAWKDEDRWRSLDPLVRSELRALKVRKVSALQACSFWPQFTKFYDAEIVNGDKRALWVSQKRTEMDSSAIVFLDPDNGLRETQGLKHATYDEARHFVAASKCLVFITFPKRENHVTQVQKLHTNLVERTGCKRVLTMRVSVSIRNRNNSGYIPTFRWFTIANPDEEIASRVTLFAKRLNEIVKVTASIHETPNS